MTTKQNYFDMKTAARIINAMPLKLLAALEDQGILYRDNNNSRAVRIAYVQQGYFDNQLTSFRKGPVEHFRNKIIVTQKGIAFLREFCANNNIPRARIAKNETQAA